MKIYDCTMAPNPRRLRMFMAKKNIQIPMVQVDIPGGENLLAPFLAMNPRGLLPVLQLDDGIFLDEVVAICRYPEAQHPEPRLMGGDPLLCARIESRNRRMEQDGFQPAIDAFRNSAPPLAERGTPGVAAIVSAIPALAQRGFEGVARFHTTLDALLGRHRYAAGEAYSIADITAVCVIDFAKWVERDIPDECGNLQRWYREMSACSGFHA